MTRPTSDRVREATFSRLVSLGPVLDGAHVLDAYAGSGALGIEALSRGAAHATFVDRDRSAVRVIRQNLEDLGLTASASVVGADISTYTKRLTGESTPFSLLFLDPPYRINKSEVRQAVEMLARSGSLSGDAIVVWEHSSAEEIEWPPEYESFGTRRYGDTAVDIAARRGE